MADLKLQALDAEDVAVVSAHCQDAIVRAGDMTFDKPGRRFVLVCNRFDWPSAAQPRRAGPYERRRTGLRFETVTAVKVTGFDPRQADRALVLLAIQTNAPVEAATQITLLFADGAAIRLDVETIEVELKDLGGVWSTRSKPDHVDPTSSDPSAPTAPPPDKPVKP
jgi:Protein of unknown function (DUF2948)